MTDNSTGSSGSSTNSWTILSTEEATIENVGPVDDRTESLGDVPSLSDDIVGSVEESMPSEAHEQTHLTEEGHQVCQETAPDLLSPLDCDLESQPPVIHDIVTSSPGDNELLGNMPFVTNIVMDLLPVEPIPSHSPVFEASSFAEPTPDAPTNLGQIAETPVVETNVLEGSVIESLVLEKPVIETPDVSPVSENPATEAPVIENPATEVPVIESPAVESPLLSTVPDANILVESITSSELSPHVDADVSSFQESLESYIPIQEDLAAECLIPDTLLPKTITPTEAAEGSDMENKETELPVKATDVDREEVMAFEQPASHSDFVRRDMSADDGLRKRNVPSFETYRARTSDEEDEESEVEFRLAEQKEEKRGFSLNKCIVAALVLLCLGSLFLSDVFTDLDDGISDDFESSDLSAGEENQDWLNSDPQAMKELLDKLAQENQQISQLEARLQSQKEELDAALKAAATKGDKKEKESLEKENAKMKEELSSLPGLREELETLRARVNELTHLTAKQDASVPSPRSAPVPAGQPGESNQSTAGPEKTREHEQRGSLKEELHRQKVLLEESRKRLEGMKRSGSGRKGVRDRLEEIQRRLSEQVEHLGRKKAWESKHNGNRGKESDSESWRREKKEWKGEKDQKHGKEDGRKEKDERREKDWKSHSKGSSHKDAWKRYQAEWEGKKHERRMDREKRRTQKPWHKPAKSFYNHQHQHQQQQQQHHHYQPQQFNHDDFWRHQGEKLRRSVRPQTGCHGVDDCASKEGLYPVELPEFEELLEGYLSKLEGSPPESKDEVRKLTAEFFVNGVFVHDRVPFSEFVEEVSDVLEDMADVLEEEGQDDGDALEEEMEEFEREALWKFAATA